MKRSYKLLLKTLLTVVFIYSSVNLSAQTPAKFSSDSIAFFDEMEDYLSNARKEGKDFMKQFKVVWYGGYFSETQREGVYAVSNIMLKKKLRAFPDFRNYLHTVGSFVVDSNQTDQSFQAWQGILLELLEDRNARKFTQFLDFCNGLFRENVIYSSASTIWSANNSNYTFAYDSLPKITFDELDLICFAKRDSMIIYNTKGAYYPTTNSWVGVGGKVLWKKAGFESKDVYADLRNYAASFKVST